MLCCNWFSFFLVFDNLSEKEWIIKNEFKFVNILPKHDDYGDEILSIDDYLNVVDIGNPKPLFSGKYILQFLFL